MKQTKFDTKNVTDATEDITLTILPTDIIGADLKTPGNCVAARACRRQENLEARIHITRVYLRNGGTVWTRYIVPTNLRTEIIAYDRGGAFVPGTYQLKAPKSTEKLGEKRSIKRNERKESKNKKKYMTTKDIRTGPANGL
jgi:hypothetical protein